MDYTFTYMLLSRLVEDCKYYLGFGARNKKYLWALDESEQITKMKELWRRLPEKPAWTSLEEIENFEQKMFV